MQMPKRQGYFLALIFEAYNCKACRLPMLQQNMHRLLSVQTSDKIGQIPQNHSLCNPAGGRAVTVGSQCCDPRSSIRRWEAARAVSSHLYMLMWRGKHTAVRRQERLRQRQRKNVSDDAEVHCFYKNKTAPQRRHRNFGYIRRK